MFRPKLEALETRETPSATGGHTGGLIGIDFRPAAGTARPIEEVSFVYHRIVVTSPVAGNEKLTVDMNRTESAIVFVGGWGSSMYQYS